MLNEMQVFIADISCLEPVIEYVNRLNIFEILGMTHAEVRHSNMLAWLIDPRKNHGLGDAVLRGILERVADNLPAGFSTFQIERERKHMDIFAVSDAEKYALCIENKIGTGEHDNQLARYRKDIEETYPTYQKQYIYLSPKGKESSDPQNWAALSYGDVLAIVESAKAGKTLNPEQELIISNYADLIRRRIIGDDKIRQVCEEIYRKHTTALETLWKDKWSNVKYADIDEDQWKALDVIFRNRPGKWTDSISSIMHTWAVAKEETGEITLYHKQSPAYPARFKTECMSGLLPDVPDAISGWETNNFYFYEMRNMRGEIFIQLSIDTLNMPAELISTCKKLTQFYPLDFSKRFIGIDVTPHVVFDESFNEEAVNAQIDQLWERVQLFESRLREL